MKKRLLSVFLAFLLVISSTTVIPASAEQAEPRAMTFGYYVISTTPLYSAGNAYSTIITYLYTGTAVSLTAAQQNYYNNGASYIYVTSGSYSGYVPRANIIPGTSIYRVNNSSLELYKYPGTDTLMIGYVASGVLLRREAVLSTGWWEVTILTGTWSNTTGFIYQTGYVS